MTDGQTSKFVLVDLAVGATGQQPYHSHAGTTYLGDVDINISVSITRNPDPPIHLGIL